MPRGETWLVSDDDYQPRGPFESMLVNGIFAEQKHGELIKTVVNMLNAEYQRSMSASYACRPSQSRLRFSNRSYPCWFVPSAARSVRKASLP